MMNMMYCERTIANFLLCLCIHASCYISIWVTLVIPVPNISLQRAEPDAESMRYKATGRTIAQIEADIAAVKANPNWATSETALIGIAALTNQLPQTASKDRFSMLYGVGLLISFSVFVSMLHVTFLFG